MIRHSAPHHPTCVVSNHTPRCTETPLYGSLLRRGKKYYKKIPGKEKKENKTKALQTVMHRVEGTTDGDALVEFVNVSIMGWLPSVGSLKS